MQIERVNPILGSDTEHAVYVTPTVEQGRFIGNSLHGGAVGKLAVIHGLPPDVCSLLKNGEVFALDDHLPVSDDGSGTRYPSEGIGVFIKTSEGASEGVSDLTEVVPFENTVVEIGDVSFH